MDLGNLHLFELVNAGAPPEPLALMLALIAAQWLVLVVPLGWLGLWLRGDQRTRLDLAHVALAALISLALAQLVGRLWPSPRPFMLHLGHQYLAHAADSGLPSDHVTLIWSVALGMLATARIAWLVFPLLTLGVIVGWARIYLGVHFPLDVAGALPVAAIGTLAAWRLREPAQRWLLPLLVRYDAWERAALRRLHR